MERTYPEVTDKWNVSKETTYREVCNIEGLTTKQVQEVAINLTAAKLNAYEICRMVHNAPRFDALLKSFIQDCP